MAEQQMTNSRLLLRGIKGPTESRRKNNVELSESDGPGIRQMITGRCPSNEDYGRPLYTIGVLRVHNDFDNFSDRTYRVFPCICFRPFPYE